MWRARVADDDLRRDGIGLDVDDDTWSEVIVPGHWRNHPDFADSDGPLLYRSRYRMPAPDDGKRRWVTFDGIFYQADAWLDGAYLGDPEGYFFPHSYDITALSRIGDEHVLAVEVSCAPQRNRDKKRNITGVFQHWDGIDRNWNPGGIWRGVHVYDTGPVKIDRYRVVSRDVDETRAHVLLSARLDSDAARSVTIRTLVDGECIIENERRVASGRNDVNWKLDIADPQLWWPRQFGEQHLTDISIEIVVDGVRSDERSRRTGMREVAWNNWTCSVNGERIFLKGANLLPTRAALGDATAAECRRDVELAVEAGLDMLRIHGHIADPAVYEAADELGVLLMQDFPLQWGYDRSVRQQAVEQARAAVDMLGHHPSIVQWSAHNDPASVAIGIEGDTTRSRLRYLAAHQLPSWNKSVLDRWVKRAIERADPTRLVSPHSGVLPHLPMLDGTDSHFYFGWYHGDATDLGTLVQRVPRVARFVSEFGAQAAPDNAPFIDEQLRLHRWPDLDWAMLAERHGLQKWVFDERVAPAEFATFDEWRDATQHYQAALIKHHVEVLRREKYGPVGGFAMFAFNDPAPMVSWSVLDHERAPKLGYAALRDACRPTIITARHLDPVLTAGEQLRVPLYVINDRREAVSGMTVDAVARWAGGERRWRFGGDVEADSVHEIARIDLTVPDTPGALTFDLALDAPGFSVTNHYRSAITLVP